MDLGDLLDKAVRAAQRGDLDALEAHLETLRQTPLESVASMSLRLRSMATSVRAHPSFGGTAEAQAV